MALTAQPSAPAGWERWPQHHPNNDYVMMDADVMPYNARPMTTAPMQQRPSLVPHYIPTTSMSTAPITSISAPAHYQPSVSYGGGYPAYPLPSPTTMSSQYRHQHYQERPSLHMITPELEDTRGPHHIRDARRYSEESRSPSERSDSQASTAETTISNHSTCSRTITPNAPVNGAPQVEFSTAVDKLMKVIQSKMKDTDAEQSGDDKDIKVEQQSSPDCQARVQQPADKQKRKRYECQIEGCNKKFSQKTHRDTHVRSHTGDRPYVCPIPGCGGRFTQAGNLKTHKRRHTGERPYRCEVCDKGFVQRGDVKAHMKTHLGTKAFLCRLDNCHKQFTQRGNLKYHQNKYHNETIKALAARFDTIEDWSTVSKEDMEIFKDFAVVHKNSNKGIKGRGKHRKVKSVPQSSPTSPTGHSPLPNIMASQYPLPSGPGLSHLLHSPHPLHPPLHHQGPSHSAMYGMPRPGFHGHYETYDHHEVDTVASSRGSVAEPIYHHHEEHPRELAFGDRIY
ncbi:hypothetical protein SMACR_04411 [Sordaria macrospora]|uniref:WGS project CABT00000000 data, contig 2.14 n=2 Tax=Sordaria macrospora TaxID=5147 RepID=F7VZ04_SORMK|nr:uncharacterized protein SMAC_04411 [Sordaria macrospora k-hell]KAA8631477.1 hypothetical protein SMACR_04411 [Sordaria macrospora]WPJ59877.1 hypothetical protein SMAC4_04411 [Sordaria macrospora]CCC10751.1 unnamed protein product [Sordaria macrospora k-hell]